MTSGIERLTGPKFGLKAQMELKDWKTSQDPQIVAARARNAEALAAAELRHATANAAAEEAAKVAATETTTFAAQHVAENVAPIAMAHTAELVSQSI